MFFGGYLDAQFFTLLIRFSFAGKGLFICAGMGLDSIASVTELFGRGTLFPRPNIFPTSCLKWIQRIKVLGSGTWHLTDIMIPAGHVSE